MLGGRYAVGGDDEHAIFMDKPAELLGAVNGTGTERQVVQVVGIVLGRVDAGDAQLLKQLPEPAHHQGILGDLPAFHHLPQRGIDGLIALQFRFPEGKPPALGSIIKGVLLRRFKIQQGIVQIHKYISVFHLPFSFWKYQNQILFQYITLSPGAPVHARGFHCLFIDLPSPFVL